MTNMSYKDEDMVTFTTRIPVQLAEELDTVAKALNISRNQLVNIILAACVSGDVGQFTDTVNDAVRGLLLASASSAKRAASKRGVANA